MRHSPTRLIAIGSASLLVLVMVLAHTSPTAAVAPDPSPQIVGGNEAEPGAWPFQVALVKAGGDPYDKQYCGGVLVAPAWVLTAAHCVDGDAPTDVEVIAGIHNLPVPDPGFQRLRLAEIIIHPDYDPVSDDSDIALLRLLAPAPFREMQGDMLPIGAVQPVAATVGALTGTTATVVGWGSTVEQPSGRPPNYPPELRQVDVPILANAQCDQSYRGEITPTMLCAGYPEGGKDSCQGDSGGPLLVWDAATQMWQVAGIVSWGSGCALAGFPGVYARVSVFSDWIATTIAIPGEPCAVGSAAEQSDCGVLLQLYDAMNGASWFNQSGWLSGGSICGWYGVVCTDERVSQLRLASNGLSGRLPDAIAQLGALKHLDIGANPALRGPLSQGLTELSLTEFRFFNTGLCATTDARMQLWLAAIPELAPSGLNCHSAYLPAAVGE